MLHADLKIIYKQGDQTFNYDTEFRLRERKPDYGLREVICDMLEAGLVHFASDSNIKPGEGGDNNTLHFELMVAGDDVPAALKEMVETSRIIPHTKTNTKGEDE